MNAMVFNLLAGHGLVAVIRRVGLRASVVAGYRLFRGVFVRRRGVRAVRGARGNGVSSGLRDRVIARDVQ